MTDKEIHLVGRLSRQSRHGRCMLSARVPISTHCNSLAYYNGLTRVRRLRRLKKIRVPCSNCFCSAAESTISGLNL
jgi:hypothetical protein